MISTASGSAPWPSLLAGGLALGLVSLVAYTIRAILKGDLVPGRQVAFWRNLYEQEQHEHEKTRDAMLALITTDRAGIEAARLAADVMQGIKAQNPRPREPR